MELLVVFDDELLGKDFIDDIDVVSSEKSVKRLNRISKMSGEPKRTDIIVGVTTHEKLPELLKTIDPNNPDNDAGDEDDDDGDADDDVSDGSSDDDNVVLPTEVYLVTPYEEEESEKEIDYEREIEIFTDEVDARVYAETRKRDPLFKDILMAIVKKKVFRDAAVKKAYEDAKVRHAQTSDVKKKKSSSSSASASLSSATASTESRAKKSAPSGEQTSKPRAAPKESAEQKPKPVREHTESVKKESSKKSSTK